MGSTGNHGGNYGDRCNDPKSAVSTGDFDPHPDRIVHLHALIERHKRLDALRRDQMEMVGEIAAFAISRHRRAHQPPPPPCNSPPPA